MKKKKVLKQFEYDGFGFPILLLDVPMVNIRGVEVPDINYNTLGTVVLEGLAHKHCPLTGNEIRFIRQSFKMTFVDFAEHFGVTHPAVIKWEKTGNQVAKITPSTELYIRLYILQFLKANNQQFRSVFVAFDNNEKLKKSDKVEGVVQKPLKIESRRAHL